LSDGNRSVVRRGATKDEAIDNCRAAVDALEAPPEPIEYVGPTT